MTFPDGLIDACLAPGCGRVDTLDASGKCAACAPASKVTGMHRAMTGRHFVDCEECGAEFEPVDWDASYDEGSWQSSHEPNCPACEARLAKVDADVERDAEERCGL